VNNGSKLTPASTAVNEPVTALRLGTAQTESILRRFTKNNVQHPTYKSFATTRPSHYNKPIFLCRYLHSEALRREISRRASTSRAMERS
jgi:TnpA family transposase